MNIKKQFLTKKMGFFLLSILLPILIMIGAYALRGIYYGSELSLTASDSYSQYTNFHASLRNVLSGEQSIFYTWNGSLGLNYWAFAAYYLNGIFTPLVYFFDNQKMVDTIYILTLLKFGAMGGTFWFFAHRTFKISLPWQTVLSVSYALMAYTVAYSPVIMWLDTFVYLPLIILGIHQLLEQRKPLLLFVSYLLLFLSNFYMAFIVGVFTFLYVIGRLVLKPAQWKQRFGLYLFTSLMAGGASMVTILPTVMDLSNNGESLTSLTSFFTKDTGFWDILAKQLVGVYDTSQYESAPFIGIGLVPLILCLFYFVSKKFKLKEKLVYGSLFIVLIASVYIEPLNLFWHGFHAPNMFLFRFSFLLSFMVILVAGYALEKVTKEDLGTLLNLCLGLGALILAMVIFSNKKRYSYLTTETVVWTCIFLVAYIVLLAWLQYRPQMKKVIVLLFLGFMVGEISVNAYGLIQGIGRDWGYPARSNYEKNYPEIHKLVDQTKSENKDFYRLENIDPVTKNDSFNYGYNGISMFSSIRNRHSSAYLNSLGYRSLGTNLSINYQNNTLVGDALLGVRYNLAKEDPLKFGFNKVSEAGDYSLYENQEVLPLGVLTDKGIYDNTKLTNQNDLLSYLAGKEKGNLFSVTEAIRQKVTNTTVQESEKTVTFTPMNPGKDQSVSWSITVPAHQQAYLSIYPVSFTAMGDADLTIDVNGVQRKRRISEVGQYYSLGYYEKETTITVTTYFHTNNSLELYTPDVLLLDTKAYKETVEAAQENGVDLKVAGRQVTGSVVAEKNQVLWTSIPYDAGWSATIDGKKVPVKDFKQAFLALDIPKGTHEIHLTFLPQGFKIGATLFVVCLVVFISYLIWQKRKGKKIDE